MFREIEGPQAVVCPCTSGLKPVQTFWHTDGRRWCPFVFRSPWDSVLFGSFSSPTVEHSSQRQKATWSIIPLAAAALVWKKKGVDIWAFLWTPSAKFAPSPLSSSFVHQLLWTTPQKTAILLKCLGWWDWEVELVIMHFWFFFSQWPLRVLQQ